jgi:hypothetical protein
MAEDNFDYNSGEINKAKVYQTRTLSLSFLFQVSFPDP